MAVQYIKQKCPNCGAMVNWIHTSNQKDENGRWIKGCYQCLPGVTEHPGTMLHRLQEKRKREMETA